MLRSPDPDALARRLDPIDRAGMAVVDREDLRDAAVLALLLPGLPSEDDPHDGPRLLLIERAPDLRAHAGQIAFPGGKHEAGDATLVDTARREAEEEVGLPRDAVRVLGSLDPVPTPTGFLIVPFVGIVVTPWMPRATSPEVRRILTPSCTRLADPEIHRVTGRVTWRGEQYDMHEYAIGTPKLWGATARMVWDLLRRMG